ncbi:GTP cyclohydrolase II RibA [Azorhizobium doebereinerae]|uniref:GTP cyclohydrolase II RibA n=1 Tax=Azorhizobium doebereinerae TaxID=281091 RepID=UPI0003FAECB4|nr:GTP cyclohydrolase II RibA [Azorhizobium doebereinerae]
MSPPVEIPGLSFGATQTAVERAIAELRSGRPVVIGFEDQALLVIGVEALDAGIAEGFTALGPGLGRLVLPAPRLTRIGAPRSCAGSIALPDMDLARIETLALRIDGRIDAPVALATPLDRAALELLGFALLLPAAVVTPIAGDALPHLLRVEKEDIAAFHSEQVRSLHVVGRAPVPLEGAVDTEFVVFRGGEGLRDQVAVVVGKPDLTQAVPVRLHSACLTGDLFGSLKCDCGDQLRDTVQRMARSSGGILLYLDQEGRGNGIANKMRAYQLQSQGFDTYEADAALGFDLDQRRFDFAAEMLRQLGVAAVEIITNNPQKIAALKAAGIDVVADRRVLGRPTAENVRYLASKRDRAGHYIDFDALTARASD